MDRTALHNLLDRLVDVEADGVAVLDREAAGAVLGEIARLRSWAEHLRLGVVARVAELSPTPERDIADADGSSARGAARDITTAQTLGGGQLGGAAESLAAGATTRGHIDVLADAYRSLDSTAVRDRFRDQLPTLDAMARYTPVDAFARHVRQLVDRLRREVGEDRLTQQRRNSRLSIRTDMVSGMMQLDGRFDPRSGLVLRNRLEEIRQQLAASGAADGPDTPTDPLARQSWLLAQALVHLVQGTAAPARRPEISIVIDTRRGTSGGVGGTGSSASAGGRGGAARNRVMPDGAAGGGARCDGAAVPGGAAHSAVRAGEARRRGVSGGEPLGDDSLDGVGVDKAGLDGVELVGAGLGGLDLEGVVSDGMMPGGDPGGVDLDWGDLTGGELLDQVLRAAAQGLAEIDWGTEVELPSSEVRAVAEQAVVSVIVTDGGRVVEAPGVLDRGRASRLASADQRRVLRALYPRCAIPDCPVPFDRCDIHHVLPWEQGGLTDLDNLLPVCAHHHQTLHAQQWGLELDADRILTITLPDRRVLRSAPSHRAAA